MFLSLETEPSTAAAMKAQDWKGFLKLDYFLLARMHTRKSHVHIQNHFV